MMRCLCLRAGRGTTTNALRRGGLYSTDAATATATRAQGPVGDVKGMPREEDTAVIHPKMALYQLCDKLKVDPPVFQRQMQGAPHQRSFVSKLTVSFPKPTHYTSRPHSNAKDAEWDVAEQACKELFETTGLLDEEYRVSKRIASRFARQVRQRRRQDPKNILMQLFMVGNQQWPQGISYKSTPESNSFQCTFAVDWPFKMSVTGIGQSKKSAEKEALSQAIELLRQEKYVNDDDSIRLYTTEELQSLRWKQEQPSMVVLPQQLLDRINKLINNFDMLEEDLSYFIREQEKKLKSFHTTPFAWLLNREVTGDQTDEAVSSSLALNEIEKEHSVSTDAHNEVVWKEGMLLDFATGRVVGDCTETELSGRSEKLHSLLMRRTNDESKSAQFIRQQQIELPIYERKQELLDLIENNRVVVVCGETGCGKTTQLPQYIFDAATENYAGSKTNIIITQPRRVSAISVASRVAHERREPLAGEGAVGYRVRLDHRLVNEPGGMMFVTPGMLLRLALMNNNFEGVSHLIIDEVHESDIWTDLLLIVAKKALHNNPKLKLILMSASIQPQKFSHYFDNCPIATVSGRVYQVTDYFLEDIGKMMNRSSSFALSCNYADTLTDHPTIVDTICHIHRNKPEKGAILCFLPSWFDMEKVRQLLNVRTPLDCRQMDVHMCHSRVPLSAQRAIFEPPPHGMRKVILATNIAESSITINDVRYVINTGTVKDRIVNKENYLVSSLNWASKASQKQRRGRAGRVADGECYHMFSRDVYKKMNPLEMALTLAKLYAPSEPVGDFLLEAVEPPSPSQVKEAMSLLSDLEIFDADGELTVLGLRVAHFGCHPRTARALVWAVLFGCVEPVITISSCLESNYELFSLPPDQKHLLKPMLTLFEADGRNDFLRFCNTFRSLHEAQHRRARYLSRRKLNEKKERENYILDAFLDYKALNFIRGLRILFGDFMVTSGFLPTMQSCLINHSRFNEQAHDENLVTGALAAGMGVNLARVRVGALRRGRIDDNVATFVDRHGNRVFPHTDSAYAQDTTPDSNWLSYYIKVKEQESAGGALMLRHVAKLHNFIPLLFSSFPLTTPDSEAPTIQLGSIYQFRFVFDSTEQRDAILNLRHTIQRLMHILLIDLEGELQKREHFVEENSARLHATHLNSLRHCQAEMRDVVADLLKCEQPQTMDKLRQKKMLQTVFDD